MRPDNNLSWEGKVEPQSPFFSDRDDLWLFEDNLDTDFLLSINKVEDDQTTPEKHYNKGRMAEQLLFELEQVKEEEPFQQWLEEKIDLPLFDDYSVLPMPAEPMPHKVFIKTQLAPLSPPLATQDTQTLLQEFETIYGVVEFNHLTPPQSPPSYKGAKACNLSDTELVNFEFSQNLLTLQPTSSYHISAPLQNITPIYSPIAPLIKNELYKSYQHLQNAHLLPVPLEIMRGYDLSDEVASPQPNIDRELADVDELVRSCAQDLPENIPIQWNRSNNGDSSPQRSGYITDSPSLSDNENMCVEEYQDISYSAQTDTSSEYNTQPLSPSSSSSCSYSTSEPDDEWIPEPVKISRTGSKPTRKRVAKPYTRPVEEKKSRKKEQNKNAATRYRQKKKAEIEDILGEERELMDKHDDLKLKCNDVEREIKYLKGLMRDLFKAKGMM